jgi:hypothetical protein
VKDKPIGNRVFRFIDRRERWGLTVWGWAAMLIVACTPVVVGIPNVHRFLTSQCPVRGQVLVVEGWVPDYAVPGVVSEFQKNGYRQLVTVGGPIERGSHLSEFKSYAQLGYSRLKALGLNDGQIAVIETQDIKRDRTYLSAVAVKEWLESSKLNVKGLNVYTLGAHARRSRLLFQKAFGDDVAVGVVAAEDQSYDPGNWWKSSNGVRTVVDELIAYLYAVILFNPEHS